MGWGRKEQSKKRQSAMAWTPQAGEAGGGTLHPSPAYRGVQHYSVLAFKDWGQDRGLVTSCQTCWARTAHGDAMGICT